MTQKELSYTEDAIGHEKAIIEIINDAASKLEDENLISFMNDEVNKHNDIKQRLINLLEDNADE